MLLARPAHVAFAAIQVGPEGHPLADAEIAVAGIDDHAAKFMPHVKIGNGFRTPALSGLPHVNITAADAAGGNPYLQHTGGHVRNGYLPDFNLLRSGQDTGLHRFLFHGNVPRCRRDCLCVLLQHRAPEKTPRWKNRQASALFRCPPEDRLCR